MNCSVVAELMRIILSIWSDLHHRLISGLKVFLILEFYMRQLSELNKLASYLAILMVEKRWRFYIKACTIIQGSMVIFIHLRSFDCQRMDRIMREDKHTVGVSFYGVEQIKICRINNGVVDRSTLFWSFLLS